MMTLKRDDHINMKHIAELENLKYSGRRYDTMTNI